MIDSLENAAHILLISVKPKYSSLIFTGKKKCELRRVRPRVGLEDVILIYESSPTMCLVGYAIVQQVLEGSPKQLWKLLTDTGVTKREFDSYYSGSSKGYGIVFSKVALLKNPISLAQIKQEINGFHPPQSYRYLSASAVISLCAANR